MARTGAGELIAISLVGLVLLLAGAALAWHHQILAALIVQSHKKGKK